MAKNNNLSNLTVFGEETSFQGVLEYTDNLVITGKFEGSIKSTGNLEIAKTAVCNVDSMSAKNILIAGNVKGNIIAEAKLEMNSGSKISGDITTKKLRIADNVDFKGKVTMFDKVPDIDIFSVSGAEYKEIVQQKEESKIIEVDEKKDSEETFDDEEN
ncbi:MAG: polymer-forming cytoskeletal protein [Treponemataceae bacterium]|nr:polymer-forming cytoskeletal protein [Treponemataceae bacterium]